MKPNIAFDKFVVGLLLSSNHSHKTKLIYPPKIAYQEQTQFLINENNDICVKYIKIENINEEWKDICEYINIPYKKIKCENKSKKNKDNWKKNNDNWKKYYDKYPYIVNIVKDYYKNDFINFNYELYVPNSYI